MEWLVWIGAGISFIGLVAVVFSIFAVTKARRAGLDDEALRERLSKILPLNMGALFISMLGLMMVVVGVILTP